MKQPKQGVQGEVRGKQIEWWSSQREEEKWGAKLVEEQQLPYQRKSKTKFNLEVDAKDACSVYANSVIVSMCW